VVALSGWALNHPRLAHCLCQVEEKKLSQARKLLLLYPGLTDHDAATAVLEAARWDWQVSWWLRACWCFGASADARALAVRLPPGAELIALFALLGAQASQVSAKAASAAARQAAAVAAKARAGV
jgi:hypothetical protein